jgi:EmrB/QacA subfamily drug resistance transporter
MPEAADTSRRLRATLILCCLAQFMVILDVSVVNVALPAIHRALRFSESGLQWVVNAYTVTFAGFLLLGGRAADLVGRRRVFVAGLTLFALASLGGGLATSQWTLIAFRLLQGLGGAVIAPASLSILTTTFTDPAQRSRAVGVWGAMGGAGGAAGSLAGGVLTQELSWRWILFVNVPIGLAGALCTQRIVAEGINRGAHRSFDVAGAVAATLGLSLLVFGIVRTDSAGWGSAGTLAPVAGGAALLGLFVAIEGRFARAPLMPLRIFRSRALSAANLSLALVGAATFSMWFFLTLYLQDVLGYSALKAGLAFIPMAVLLAAGSAIGSRAVVGFGAKRLLVTGMALQAIGLYVFSRFPVHGSYLTDVLPGALVLSFGIGLAFVTGAISATSGVAPHEAGLASGLLNTARMFGGALGLAVLATLATSHTRSDLHRLHSAGLAARHAALTSGFGLAFAIAAGVAAAGGLVALVGLPSTRGATPAHDSAHGSPHDSAHDSAAGQPAPDLAAEIAP